VDAPQWFLDALATLPEHAETESDGATIHYRRWGSTARPGLVLDAGCGSGVKTYLLWRYKGVRTLGVDYSLTTSCYDPSSDGSSCGHCDACQLRLKGFAGAQLHDPIRYVAP